MLSRFRTIPHHLNVGRQWLMAVGCLAIVSGAAHAVSFGVTGFVIQGDNPLGESAAQRLLAPFLGQQDDIDGLRAAAAALEGALLRRGHAFHRVSLPPQKLESGMVALRISRLRLGKVETAGNQYFSDRNLLRSLPTLVSGETPNQRRLQRSLALANSNSAKQTQLTFSRGAVLGTMDALIKTQETNPQQWYLWANNTGSEASTESRLGLGYQHRNLFDLDHQLNLTTSVSPEDTSRVQQYGVNYQIPLYRVGGIVNLMAAKSTVDSGRIAEVFDVSGGGTVVGAGYTQIFNKWGPLRQQIGLTLTDKLFENDVSFDGEQIGQSVRSRPATLSYQADWAQGGWSGLLRVAHDQNLPGGGLNDDDVYDLSRKGADADWQKQSLQFQTQHESSKRWLTKFELFAQTTQDALIAGEKFGLGGASQLRGFKERESNFDKGYSASLSVFGPPFGSGLGQFLLGVFYDLGGGKTFSAETGEVGGDTLKSAGVALKWSLGSRWVFDLSLGRVLDGISEEIDGGSRAGDQRVHVNLLYRID